jgi:hypothetical protein
LIGRHRQRARGLGIAGSGGKLSLSPSQGSLGGKSGTREQHGEQDTKHKAHDVTPSWLSGLRSQGGGGAFTLCQSSMMVSSHDGTALNTINAKGARRQV